MLAFDPDKRERRRQRALDTGGEREKSAIAAIKQVETRSGSEHTDSRTKQEPKETGVEGDGKPGRRETVAVRLERLAKERR